MKRTMSYRLRWSIWMTAVGLAVGLVVYVTTTSIGWTLAGLVGSGVFFNALAHPRTRV